MVTATTVNRPAAFRSVLTFLLWNQLCWCCLGSGISVRLSATSALWWN